jgi:DNA repair exonuclease SbcCD ATPase subunit
MEAHEAEKQQLRGERECLRLELQRSRDELEELRGSLAHMQRLNTAQTEANKGEKQKLQGELDHTRCELKERQEECERLHKLAKGCDKLKTVELDLQKVREDCKRLEASETQKTKLQEELGLELQKVRGECENLRTAQIESERLKLLEQDECKRLQALEAEARRARDQYHHKWCALDQERDNLQRVAQQGREAERNARACESLALEEAAAWRRWLVSFLDVLLRPGAMGFEDPDASPWQCYEKQHPKVHALVVQLSKAVESPAPQPKLLSQLRTLHDDISELLASGKLVVELRSEHDDHNFRPSDVHVDAGSSAAANSPVELVAHPMIALPLAGSHSAWGSTQALAKSGLADRF